MDDQERKALVKDIVEALHNYDMAREALRQGAHTGRERQRVYDIEDAFGAALVRLIDSRITAATGAVDF